MPRSPRILRCPAARPLAAWLLAALTFAPPGLPAAWAAPEGENVVHGEASFARDGDLTVIRPSDGAIIEYTGFDILQHEAVRFEQPSEQARVLNRVSGDATHIDGSLSANGIVYLVNPAGVFFGKSAVVDVRRLVAAAGELPDHDFLRGHDAFALQGPLENWGSLEASAVTLLGRSVANHGSIVAPDGVIALVAGERVVLTQLEGGIAVEVQGPAQGAELGIEQGAAGVVDAGLGAVRFAVGDHYSLAINHDGVTRGRDIELAGGETGLVRVSGTLDASAQGPGATGGSVRVTGERVALEGARLDASGAAGGGEIRVGGDLRGAGPLRNARRSFVDAESVLRADALEAGDGGSVVLFAEEASGFLGQISARGGAAGGDGGFAELSSEGLLIDRGRVDVAAPAGDSGTLLYDPRDIVLQGGTFDGNDDPDLSQDLLDDGTAGLVIFGDASDPEPFTIYESEIEGTNANIVLEARNSITASGSFDHDAGVHGVGVLALLPDNDLILRTRNSAGDETDAAALPGINLTGSVHGADLEIRSAGDGSIRMDTGSGVSDGVEAAIRVGVLTTAGGEAFLFTEDGSISVNRITTSGADGADGGNAGRIVLNAGDEDGSGDTAIQVSGDLVARGGNGSSGTGGHGGVVGVLTRGNPGEGGGPLTLMGDIDSSGGNGPGGGGNGGALTLDVAVQGDILAGDVATRGGDGIDPDAVSNGGRGGQLQITTDDGDITIGAVDTTGGDSDGSQFDEEIVDGDNVIVPLEFGGSGGPVELRAGSGEDTTGRIVLAGNLTAQGGAGPENGDGFGGRVQIIAKDSIEHAGQAGPHVTTWLGFNPGLSSINLQAANIGALAPLEISGGGRSDGRLQISTSGTTRVLAGAEGFDTFQIRASDAAADIEIAQGADLIDVKPGGANTSDLVRLDTTESGADVLLALSDELVDDPLTPADEDLQLTLRVRTNSATPGGSLVLRSEDDIALGDSDGVAIAMQALQEPPDPDDPTAPTVSGVLALFADDDVDGKGAILDLPGAGSGRIDLVGDAEESGGLIAEAGAGVGTAADPLVIEGGGKIGVENRESGGVFVRNVAGGDLTVAEGFGGVAVLDGAGNIELDNTAGDLVLEQSVVTSGDEDGLGGAVTLRAAGGNIVLAAPPGLNAVDANDDVSFAGAVTLMQDSRVVSQEGDVAFAGAIDTDPARGDRVRSLEVVTRAAHAQDGLIRLAGDVGATTDLRDLSLLGDVVLAGGARQIHTTNNLSFGGDIRGTTPDNESLEIHAGPRVEIRGDVGVGERLSAFSIQRNATPPFLQTLLDPMVTFSASGAQRVVTGAGGIAFSPGGRATLPDRATIAKLGGDLRLESVGAGGSVNLGPNEKLTVQGRADVLGETVVIGDVSALELHVTSDNASVRARAPGDVLLKSGGSATDGGTDLFANVVDFTGANPPVALGTGPAPRIAAQSVTNSGAFEVGDLADSLGADDLVRDGVVLDLAILPADPGHETPLRGPQIAGLVAPRTSDDTASGSALPPGAEETLAWLRCSAARRDDCAVTTDSPLDSPRGAELAQDAARLLGDSPEARALRDALARLEPGALRELAVFLTEIRLLGLSDSEYRAVRDALYGEILEERGPAAPDARAFAAAVEGQARGVPL